MSLIARTAGIGRSAPELQWDLNYLLKLWTAIDGASKGGKGAFLIYQESSLVIRAIRDYFTADIGEILIDTDDIFDQAQQFMTHVMPETAHKVKRYRDDAPCSRASRSSTRSRPRSRAREPAVGRRHRHRPHRGARSRSTSTRRARPRAATSRRPPPAPTSRPPTRSRGRCGCATSAA
jgi:hypothetical protein